MLEFLGNYAKWLILVGLVLGCWVTYKAYTKNWHLLWSVLGFGAVWAFSGLANFGIVPFIGKDLGAIFGLLGGLAFGIWIPITAIFMMVELRNIGKKPKK